MSETLQEMQKRKRTGPWTKADQKKLLQRQIDRRKKSIKKTPLFKLRGDSSERRRKKRLAEEKKLKEQVRLAQGRKASEKLEDIPPVSKPKKKVPYQKMTPPGKAIPKPKVLSASDKRKIATKKREDKKKVQSSIKEQAKQLKIKAQDKKKAGDTRVLESRAYKTKPRTFKDPYKKQVKKPATGVVTAVKKKDKPKTKDMSFWETLKKGWTNLQNTPYGAKEIAESRTRAINKKMKKAPAYVKRMKEYKQISDMLKERQAKSTSKDITSGRDAEAKRKAAKLKRQAALAKVSPQRPKRPDLVTKTKPKVASPQRPKRPDLVTKIKPKVADPQRPKRPDLVTKTKPKGEAMSDRPESRSQRKDYEHFLRSRGGIEGFQFNLFGKNKTVAEASKDAKQAYDREQEDRKRMSQHDFYKYGEGRRSQLKKGGMVKRNKGGAVRGVGQAIKGFGNAKYSNKMY
jgi:hypothetical protein